MIDMKVLSANKFRNHGLLLLRVGIGVMFVMHGYPKITGGPEKWAQIGGAISYLGINFAPAFWGFMAASSEFFGGFFLIFGFLFRPAAAMLLIVMVTAVAMHLGSGDDLMRASHAIESGILFLGLIFIGPGRFSVDELFSPGKSPAFDEEDAGCSDSGHHNHRNRIPA